MKLWNKQRKDIGSGAKKRHKNIPEWGVSLLRNLQIIEMDIIKLLYCKNIIENDVVQFFVFLM